MSARVNFLYAGSLFGTNTTRHRGFVNTSQHHSRKPKNESAAPGSRQGQGKLKNITDQAIYVIIVQSVK